MFLLPFKAIFAKKDIYEKGSLRIIDPVDAFGDG